VGDRVMVAHELRELSLGQDMRWVGSQNDEEG